MTNVNFIHKQELDDHDVAYHTAGNCQPGQDGIFFRVRMTVKNDCDGSCKGETNTTPRTEIEPGWFPDDPNGFKRELTISQSGLANDTEAMINALHELGHVLGFEHEHYRSGFPECPPELVDWRELTPTDPKSVMGYQSCEGYPENQPRLSPYDRLGAFYRYNWSRRPSLLYGAVSTVSNYSFDGTDRTGVAWLDASDGSIDIWTSVGDPGQVLSFDVTHRCLSGAPPCVVADEVWPKRVQPSPMFADGTDSDLDILAFGPGNDLPDMLLNNSAPSWSSSLIGTTGYRFPIVGSFSHGIDDQAIFHDPGPAEDVLWDPSTNSNYSAEYSDYAYPLPGRYRGWGGGASDIIWYQPEYATIEVWQWLDYGGLYNFDRQGPADASLLGLEVDTEQIPLLGDFNGDERTDIFWYSPGLPTDQLWLSASTQTTVVFDATAEDVVGEYRAFVGDYDGDGTHDILWYSVLDEVEGGLSSIWYFDESGSHDARTFSVHGDYTPVVADFDRDGCTDVMWYDGAADAPQTVVWRCVPDALDFACDPPTETPTREFPIGYGGAF